MKTPKEWRLNMPLKYFTCQRGKVLISECLNNCPDRCMSLPKLYSISDQRIWNGKASTTMLMNPTRMEYLKITRDYSVNPKQRAYAIFGTYQHHRLDIVAKKLKELESEKKLENETNSGILDLLEPDEKNIGKWKLVDYKFWGAYAVKKMYDKTTYEYNHNSLQLNDYRIKVEPLGFPISRMLWEITIRDGNTKTMNEYELDDPMPTIECERMDDDSVIDYFYQKNELLLNALKTNTLPPLCDFEERWNGRRCKGSLCEIHEFCPEGRKINRLD